VDASRQSGDERPDGRFCELGSLQTHSHKINAAMTLTFSALTGE
jgi:hypothetical protein